MSIIEGIADEKFDRAPVWAKERLQLQQRRIAELYQRIEELSAGPQDSNVHVADFVYPDRPLPRNSSVRFSLGGNGLDSHQGTVTVQHSRPSGRTGVASGQLDITTTDTTRVLAFTPRAGNVMTVRLIPR